MVMRRFLSYIFLILFLVSNLFAQQQEVYKILGISVEGNTVVQPSAIIANSGLKVGDEISFTRVGNILISGDKIRNAIKQLWALRVFKKVSIEIENQVGDGVYLLIRVEEYPRLDDVIVEGAKAISVKDIKNKINLVRGQVIAENRLTSIANDIRKAYEEKGYFLVDVKFDIIPTKEGRANLKVSINEGKKISIKKIIFDVNSSYSKLFTFKNMNHNIQSILSHSNFLRLHAHCQISIIKIKRSNICLLFITIQIPLKLLTIVNFTTFKTKSVA